MRKNSAQLSLGLYYSLLTCGKLVASTELQAVERFLYVEWLHHFRI